MNGAVVWVPDHYAQYVLIDTFNASGNLTPNCPLASRSTLTRGGGNADNFVQSECSERSGGALHVVCNSDFGGADRILVYKACTLAYVKTIGGADANGAEYFTGSSLTGIRREGKSVAHRLRRQHASGAKIRLLTTEQNRN